MEKKPENLVPLEALMITELDDRREFALGVVADAIVALNGGCNGKGCTQNVFCK
jgi:hypothetical protein